MNFDCLPCAGAPHPTIKTAGRQGGNFGRISIPKNSDKQQAGYCMGKQSQIIIFRVISGWPDLGRCLRLTRRSGLKFKIHN
jgi:hypothetical protein